jgi:predicted cobalt transporter CbtA
MNRFLDGLAVVAATAWVGGLWAMGYMAAPVLFKSLAPDRQMAGMLAGNLFSVIAYAGIVCALYLLALRLSRHGKAALKQSMFWVVGSMLLLTLIGQFGLQPAMASLKAQALPLEVMQSAYSSQFKMLHGISSILYLVQSLLGLVLVLKIRKE